MNMYLGILECRHAIILWQEKTFYILYISTFIALQIDESTNQSVLVYKSFSDMTNLAQTDLHYRVAVA